MRDLNDMDYQLMEMNDDQLDTWISNSAYVSCSVH